MNEQRRQSGEPLQPRSSIGWWDWDIQTSEVAFNQGWLRMLGYSLTEIKPHLNAWQDLIHPDDYLRVTETLTAHLRGESGTFAIEYRLRSKSGDWVWIADRGCVVERNPKGEPIRFVGAQLDITGRKRLETALEQSADFTTREVRHLEERINQLEGLLAGERIDRRKLESEYEASLKLLQTQIRERADQRILPLASAEVPEATE